MPKIINRIGLGTFPLAGVFSKVTKRQAKEIVKAFLDNGGYYIDTAPLYGFGEVEKLLGLVLASYPREKYFLATKCGFVDVEGMTFKTVQKSGKYKDVFRECDRSLKRLKTDFIDLYFVHSPDPNTPFGETMEALGELQKLGKIKEIGVSNVNLKELMEYNKHGKIKYIQNRFSLINQSIDGDFEKYLLKNHIELVPYQPIERGQLTDKVVESLRLRKGDLRIGRSDWEENRLEVISVWVKKRLVPMAKKLKISIEHLALAWSLHQKYTGFVIVGAANTGQIKNNLKAHEVKLSSRTLEQIENAYKDLKDEIKEKFGQSIREFRGLNEKYY
ncbi:aldo/keto reductase [Patescibacteria group bacterium]|nr:aldo/keto reductase [Patescibacteria group bacterium]